MYTARIQNFKTHVVARWEGGETNTLMNSEWQTSLFIQPRQAISDEAVGRVRYYLGEAE